MSRLSTLSHNILPQKLLRLRDAFHQRGSGGETTTQQVLVKMSHQCPAIPLNRRKLHRLPVKQLVQ